MKFAPKHRLESERLDALRNLKILDTLPEVEFDDITCIASIICETPISLISLVDENRQWFKSKRGLDANETHRNFAFCSHAILEDGLFVVPDSTKDERFKDNPLVVNEPHVIFYAGAPVLSPNGYPIGTLCVIDSKPKVLREDQKTALRALSAQVSKLLELRMQIEEKDSYMSQLEYKKTAIENLSEGVVLQDEKSRIIHFNAAALTTLGLTADQLTGKTSMDPDWRAIKNDGSDFPGDEHPAVLALKTGRSQKNVIMGIHRPNSELRWIQINSTPIFNKQKTKVAYSVTSFSDVTEQKKAKILIEKNEANLNRVLNGVPALIGHWDCHLNNINANRAYAEFFGKTPEQIIGQSMQTILGKEGFEKNRSHVEKTLNGNVQTFEQEQTLANGKTNYFLANYLPEIENDQMIGFFVIIMDVTELKKLEIERQLLVAKMVESAKMSTLGEMAGGVAHELNTPLAIIITKVEMLLDAYKSGRFELSSSMKQLEKIKFTSERIAKIIKGLRQFSRNSEDDPKEVVRASSVVDSTLDLCQEKITSFQIELSRNIQIDANIHVKPPEISQVLMNLINNSIDAIENLSEKWIQVSVISQDDKVHISVTDSGKKISEKNIDKMMNPFFTTKEVGKGTGLGLSISKGIVEAHGGTLMYDRTCQNTRFTIELPDYSRKSSVRVA